MEEKNPLKQGLVLGLIALGFGALKLLQLAGKDAGPNKDRDDESYFIRMLQNL